MVESTPNDQAFMKVAQELRRVENSLTAIDPLRSLSSQSGQYTLAKLQEIQDGEIYTADIQQYIPLIRDLGKGGEYFINLKSKLEKRQSELKELMNAYLRGQDIVQTKLRRNL